MKMKITTLLAGLLLMACSPQVQQPAPPAPAVTPAPAAPAAPAARAAGTAASARGVVESVDTVAQTVTIAHGAVPALDWPAMTMTFGAREVDLKSIATGDDVDFQFTADGMDGTITHIARHRAE